MRVPPRENIRFGLKVLAFGILPYSLFLFGGSFEEYYALIRRRNALKLATSYLEDVGKGQKGAKRLVGKDYRVLRESEAELRKHQIKLQKEMTRLKGLIDSLQTKKPSTVSENAVLLGTQVKKT